MRWRKAHKRAKRKQNYRIVRIAWVNYQNSNPIGDILKLYESRILESLMIPVAMLTPGMESYGRAMGSKK